MRTAAAVAVAALAAALAACGAPGDGGRGVVLHVSGSGVGREAQLLRSQIARFDSLHPGIRVEIRSTPDAADPRHQLYVQWLNAHADEPDVLQLDVVWTPEFAAAGWILPLDRFAPPADSFFAATLSAARWRDSTYALPWFVDVGMLYWRTDLMSRPPPTFTELVADADSARRRGVRYGYVWQGARYEGLTTVFLEHLAGFGGRILDDDGRVVVDSDAGIRALTWLRDAIHLDSISPRAVLAWHEEQTRLAFQAGDAAFMRNWPYAYALLRDSASAVAGRFAAAPMPAAPGGRSAAALGGSQLAINARSRHPREAYALIAFLTAPRQMIERARVVGQYPTRPALYATDALSRALPMPAHQALEIIRRAVPRPVTPVYTELSEILQVWLHRALTRQVEPAAALHAAAREMRSLLRRVGLAPGAAARSSTPNVAPAAGSGEPAAPEETR